MKYKGAALPLPGMQPPVFRSLSLRNDLGLAGARYEKRAPLNLKNIQQKR